MTHHFDIPFCSYLVYPSRWNSERQKWREWVLDIKNDKRNFVARVIKHMANALPEEFRSFIHPDATLVPIPGHAPVKAADTLWTADRICEELITNSLGKSITQCLRRREVCQKSSTSRAGNRPTFQQHLDTMEISRSLTLPRRLTLVDDIITKGTTTMSAAKLIRAARPDIEISVFAVARSCYDDARFRDFITPCVGAIYDDGIRADRRESDLVTPGLGEAP